MRGTSVVEDQEHSTRLATEYINSDACRNLKRDVVVMTMVANGYAYGAYMGIRWAKRRSKGNLLSRLASLVHSWDEAELAADECLKAKFRGATPEDRQMLRFVIIKGFNRGADEAKDLV